MGNELTSLTSNFFGYSVDINNDSNLTRIAVGSLLNSDNKLRGGSIEIFDYNSSTNTWDLNGVEYGDNEQDEYGRDISISDDGTKYQLRNKYLKSYTHDGSSLNQRGSTINLSVNNLDINGLGDKLVISNIYQILIYEFDVNEWKQLGATITLPLQQSTQYQ